MQATLQRLARRFGERQTPAYSFANKVVLITGGSRGLGLVLARQLADAGARLALVARDAAELSRAAAELEGRGAPVLVIPADLRTPEIATSVIDRVVARFGRLDVLINNAGIITAGPVSHMTTSDWQDAFDVHFWAPLHLITAAAPLLHNGGRVVNIASIGGKLSVPHLVPYCASKHALVGLSNGLRAELASDGISVTTVCPGLLRTSSHVNALFKGRHEREYAWFTLLDTNPLTSISVERAASQILRACQRGQAELTISMQAKLIQRVSALAPETTAAGMRLMQALLPQPTGRIGDTPQTGWQSRGRFPALLSALGDWATRANNGDVNPERRPA